MKILLDTNVLNSSLIEQFEQANILNLVKKYQITFYLCDVLIWERLIRLCESDEKQYIKMLNFIFNYCDDRIFAPIKQIIEKEIRNKTPSGEYWFYSVSESKQLKENLYKIKSKSLIVQNVIEHQRHEKVIYEKFKKTTMYYVDGINSCKNISNEKTLMIMQEWFKREEVDKTYAQEIINKINSCNAPKVEKLKKIFKIISKYVIQRTMANQHGGSFVDAYERPFFDLFIETLLYLVTFKIEDGHRPFDKNFQDDTYICYMKDLDILLSNDANYMKDCFEHIYAGTDKKILNLNDFFDLLRTRNLIKEVV